MRSPWLDIPLADYEGHMALPEVGQAQLLSDVFADALRTHAPRAVAVLGCAGGNGFERIAPRITTRVVGVGINPAYIREARARVGARAPALELFIGDVQTETFGFSPVDLVFAGLLFEYVDAEAVLAKIPAMLERSGVLVTVVQLPSARIPAVTPTPFASLGALRSVMRLAPPSTLEHLAGAQGYQQADTRVVESAGGKRFHVQSLRRAPVA